ncbi:MAG: hypothetical protein Q8P81_00635 [Nanoarchaeota archaeon]|nr:hypothetical protein [Nanoarchaeota archaeon]
MFLYEVLVRELTKSVLSEDKERKKSIMSIIRKHFSKGSILSKELDLYRALSDTNGLKEDTAKRLVSEVSKVYGGFGFQKLQDEQNKLVSDMNKNLDKESLKTYIPNYRSMATICQIFNKKIGPKERVILEEKIVEKLTSKPELLKESVDTEPVDNFTFNVFLKSFNDTYSKNLLSEQKNLLSKYILSSMDNGIDFRVYLNEEISRLKGEIKSASESDRDIATDEEMKKKSKEVYGLLEAFREKEEINQGALEQILKIQQLVREIKE